MRECERKIEDPEKILSATITRIEARIKDAQEGFDVKWYEIDDEDRLAALTSHRTNMEF